MRAIEYARRSSCCDGRKKVEVEVGEMAAVSLRMISNKHSVLSTACGQLPRLSHTLIYVVHPAISYFHLRQGKKGAD